MIDDLDETIRQLLMDEMRIKAGEIDIAFDQPKRDWSARLSRPTINLFLYDVRENVQLREFGWDAVSESPADQSASRKMKPLRIDCHYMFTTWATEPEDEHRLLTRAMMALFRHPEISRSRLKGRLKEQAFDIRARLASHDKLANPAELWSALDNELRPSISYMITLTMDPWEPIDDPIVRTFQFDLAQVEADEETAVATPVDKPDTRLTIAGMVRRQEDQAPINKARVVVKEMDAVGFTGGHGRYKIKGIMPGEYTLDVRLLTGESAQRKIRIPAPDGNYDLEVK
ncbi:MAG: Pvc16 family protein [Chloroflexota bacterium]